MGNTCLSLDTEKQINGVAVPGLCSRGDGAAGCPWWAVLDENPSVFNRSQTRKIKTFFFSAIGTF